MIEGESIPEPRPEEGKPFEASVSVSIRANYKGFDVLFVKQTKENVIIPTIDGTQIAIEYLMKKGFTPVEVKEIEEEEKKELPAGTSAEKKELPVKEEIRYSCADCGGVADFREGLNKAGKPYKGIFCQDQNCGKVKWLNPKK